MVRAQAFQEFYDLVVGQVSPGEFEGTQAFVVQEAVADDVKAGVSQLCLVEVDDVGDVVVQVEEFILVVTLTLGQHGRVQQVRVGVGGGESSWGLLFNLGRRHGADVVHVDDGLVDLLDEGQVGQ